MYNLLQQIRTLLRDDGFTRFQNEVVQALYEVLGRGYSGRANEVALVRSLVDAVHGKSYGAIALHGTMLHGARSFVDFSYRDTPVTKELGDLAIIALATSGSKRLFQRITIVQNKKAARGKWQLDHEQLFLLKNFPPFSGYRGIFKGRNNVIFRDASGCLGSYGLFEEPGEMVFASARLVAEFSAGKQSVSKKDIKEPESVVANGRNHGLGQGRAHPWGPNSLPEMILHELVPAIPPLSAPSEFLGNVCFARDLYDLTRAWTQLSVGEVTYFGDDVVNGTVDAFCNYLLQCAGLDNRVEFPPNKLFGDSKPDGEIAVLVAHLAVEEG